MFRQSTKAVINALKSFPKGTISDAIKSSAITKGLKEDISDKLAELKGAFKDDVAEGFSTAVIVGAAPLGIVGFVCGVVHSDAETTPGKIADGAKMGMTLGVAVAATGTLLGATARSAVLFWPGTAAGALGAYAYARRYEKNHQTKDHESIEQEQAVRFTK